MLPTMTWDLLGIKLLDGPILKRLKIAQDRKTVYQDSRSDRMTFNFLLCNAHLPTARWLGPRPRRAERQHDTRRVGTYNIFHSHRESDVYRQQ